MLPRLGAVLGFKPRSIVLFHFCRVLPMPGVAINFARHLAGLALVLAHMLLRSCERGHGPCGYFARVGLSVELQPRAKVTYCAGWLQRHRMPSMYAVDGFIRHVRPKEFVADSIGIAQKRRARVIGLDLRRLLEHWPRGPLPRRLVAEHGVDLRGFLFSLRREPDIRLQDAHVLLADCPRKLDAHGGRELDGLLTGLDPRTLRELVRALLHREGPLRRRKRALGVVHGHRRSPPHALHPQTAEPKK